MHVSKNLKTTLQYTQRVALPKNKEYTCTVTKSVEGINDMIVNGFEYMFDVNRCRLFHKNEYLISGYVVPPNGPVV